MARLVDALKAISGPLEDKDLINRAQWNSLCAKHITMDRGQATFLWGILCSDKFFIPINGTTWKVNHEQILDEIIKGVNKQTNPESGVA